jgi:thiol:disulfide interchange protein
VPILQKKRQEVWSMEIQWRDDVDAALADAKRDGRPVLLDFSAAPM